MGGKVYYCADEQRFIAEVLEFSQDMSKVPLTAREFCHENLSGTLVLPSTHKMLKNKPPILIMLPGTCLIFFALDYITFWDI